MSCYNVVVVAVECGMKQNARVILDRNGRFTVSVSASEVTLCDLA